jgi:chaperonin cofactor prefoldin
MTNHRAAAPNRSAPRSSLWERITATATGILILSFAAYLVYRNQSFTDANLVVLARGLLSLGVALFVATLPGFIDLRWNISGIGIRAGGALAVFVFTFAYTPKVLPSLSVTPLLTVLQHSADWEREMLREMKQVIAVLREHPLNPAQKSLVDEIDQKVQTIELRSETLASQLASARSSPDEAAILRVRDLQERATSIENELRDLNKQLSKVPAAQEAIQPEIGGSKSGSTGTNGAAPEPGAMQIGADDRNWTIKSPFARYDGSIRQSIDTQGNLSSSGQAALNFSVPEDGDYGIICMVNAPSPSSNSFLVDVDAPPTDPTMIWDIPITNGFESRVVSWRGSGSVEKSEFVPKLFRLNKSVHQLVIYGRHPNVRLEGVSIIGAPGAPTNLGIRSP